MGKRVTPSNAEVINNGDLESCLKRVQATISKLKCAEKCLTELIKQSRGKSPRGCSWDINNRTWRVRASVDGKLVNVGSYGSLAEAEAAYIAAKGGRLNASETRQTDGPKIGSIF